MACVMGGRCDGRIGGGTGRCAEYPGPVSHRGRCQAHGYHGAFETNSEPAVCTSRAICKLPIFCSCFGLCRTRQDGRQYGSRTGWSRLAHALGRHTHRPRGWRGPSPGAADSGCSCYVERLQYRAAKCAHSNYFGPAQAGCRAWDLALKRLSKIEGDHKSRLLVLVAPERVAHAARYSFWAAKALDHCSQRAKTAVQKGAASHCFRDFGT